MSRFDILTVGEAMGLVVSEEPGPLATADRARLSVGGSELNVAIGLARLGFAVAWVSRLGRDAFGDRVARTLRAEGVQVLARRDSTHLTGLMVKERRTASVARVTYHRKGSAASFMAPTDVPDEAIASCKLVHLTGITPALSESARETVRSVLRRARRARVPVSFDVNYRSSLWSREEASAEYRQLLPYVDLLFGGPDELALLDAQVASDASVSEKRAILGVPHLIVKDGVKGASAATVHESYRQQAFPVEVVDTVGAGDAFVAGYLSAWLGGAGLSSCLERGARAGAFLCTVPGDWEGAPTVDELAFLGSVEPVQR